MSVNAAGVNWRTLKQQVMMNNQPIKEIYVGNKLVYPATEPEPEPEDQTNPLYKYAMWFKFDTPILSNYSPRLVDRYGCYLYFTNKKDVEKLHRMAIFVNDTTSGKFRRTMLASFESGLLGRAVYVPFVAFENEIIADGLMNEQIQTYDLNVFERSPYMSYSTNDIGVNLEDAYGHLLQNYYVEYDSTTSMVLLSSKGETLNDAVAYIRAS